MMGRSLLIVGSLATLGLVATAAVSFAGLDVSLHILLALVSSLLLLFSHCWIMFYLIGTGKAIKETVAEHSLAAGLVGETRRFKARAFPSILLALVVAMATFILGGGVYTGSVPPWVHHTLFWLALAVQVRTLWLEQQVLSANERLMVGINRQLGLAERR
jgi:hypothetical protein